MCEFISWIEYKDEFLYLTSKDLETSKGRKLYKDVGVEDIKGHGAIRKFFNLGQKEGINMECEDFSVPENFPKDIVRDIKKGLFAGFGIAEKLLTKPAWADYKKIKQSAWADCKKIQQPAQANYKKIEQSAWADYKKIKQSAFWELVKIKANRVKAWQ